MTTTKTIEQVIAEERAADAKWAAETRHGPYTIAELRETFAKVRPATNWKTRIDATVELADADRTVTAIEFFVGGQTKRIARADGRTVRLINAGYYANIGP